MTRFAMNLTYPCRRRRRRGGVIVRAIFRQSGGVPGGGDPGSVCARAAAVSWPSPPSSRWYTRSVPVQLLYDDDDTRARISPGVHVSVVHPPRPSRARLGNSFFFFFIVVQKCFFKERKKSRVTRRNVLKTAASGCASRVSPRSRRPSRPVFFLFSCRRRLTRIQTAIHHILLFLSHSRFRRDTWTRNRRRGRPVDRRSPS